MQIIGIFFIPYNFCPVLSFKDGAFLNGYQCRSHNGFRERTLRGNAIALRDYEAIARYNPSSKALQLN